MLADQLKLKKGGLFNYLLWDPKFIEAASMSRGKGFQMKTSMKKLTVFVMMAAIALFASAATASAGGQTIKGEYAIFGSGACLFAPGFTDDTHFIPSSTVGVTVGPNTWEGVYTFYKDGTGEIIALNRFVDTTPSAGRAQISWKFTYTVDGDKITFTYIPNTYVATWDYGPLAGVTLTDFVITTPYSGRISPDGKNLFVSFGVPMKLIAPFPGLEIVCNGVLQGFRTNK